MKSLETIQKLAKLGRILSKIVFVLCVIASGICLLGLLCTVFLPEEAEIGNVAIQGMTELPQEVKDNMTEDTFRAVSYVAMGLAMIICACEAALAKMAERYFKHELEAGTPFTFDGAQELKRLGIYTIVLPLVTSVIAQIALFELEKHLTGKIDDTSTISVSLGLGIMMLVMSVVCKYGAEIMQKKSASASAKKK